MRILLNYFSNLRLDPKSAWLSVLAAALFNILGMVLHLEINRHFVEIPAYPSFLSMGIGFFVLAVLLIKKSNFTVRLSVVLYTINVLGVVTALFITDQYFSNLRQQWVPFQANKLGCLVTSMLAPTFFTGLIGITLHAGTVIVNLSLLPLDIQNIVRPVEPMATMAFGLAGYILLYFRFRRIQTERDIQKIQTEVAAVQELAKAFLSLRDLMNTPLQTIELALHMTKESNTNPKIIHSLERSLNELNKVNSKLKSYEHQVQWSQAEDLTSRIN